MGLKLTQIPLISLILLFMMINLTEIDGMVVGHIRVLRVLRFPKLTQIPQISLILLLMMSNLTEFGRKVVGISECSECSDFQNSHRFNKIQQKIICENLC